MKRIQPTIDMLRNQLDYRQVPFSDRGSRLLVFQEVDRSQLYIKLAERLTSIEADPEAYLLRPPFVRDLCLVDEQGQSLDFQATSYPHTIQFTTRLGDFGLTFQDNQTLAIGLPPQRAAGIRFHVTPQWWRALQKGGEFKSIRNLVYDTNSSSLRNQITPQDGGYTVEFIIEGGNESTITLRVGERLPPHAEVPPFSKILLAAEQRWQEWLVRVPAVAEHLCSTYAYAWWVMGNNLVRPLGSLAYEAMMPSKIHYVGLWLWDSAMHVLAYRHIDPELGRNQIRAMLSGQLPDGMLPDAIYDEGVIAEIDHPIKAEVTKPPILAWAALKLHEIDPDLDFLQEIYVPLVRWNAWWFSMNDDDADGLVQYNHPYSSGLDDNPLWDYGMPVESPDLNTYLCVQMGSLALMAEALGMEAEGQMWRRRAAAIVRRMIQDFWDQGAGIFRATHDHQPIPVLTPFNLYPLWTGQLPDHIRERLIAHLTDPAQFWGTYAIPSVSRSDPHYDPQMMWRGPVWVNINYFFIEALELVGQHELAQQLRQKTLALIMGQPGIYEYYDSETGKAPPKAAGAFGWTAAVFIDLAIRTSQVRQAG